MKIIGSIEARMGSSRLPGKTMQPVFDDMPLLEAVFHRFRQCRQIDGLLVATSVAPGDDVIAIWCTDNDVVCHRGSEDDVLARVVGAARAAGADAIVQMGADSAYLDALLIDQLIGLYKDDAYDLVCNTLELTYPLGIYGHIVRVSSLEDINRRDDLSPADREDVTRYIWEHKEQFRLLNIKAPPELHYPELRFTVDYPEDMVLAQNIYTHFGGLRFTTADLIALYRRDPSLFADTLKLKQEAAPHLSLMQR
ncbi:MAG: NTP transferase domain-containing protein [Rhodospirillaceae bacterium]|jgi:spore coat polysaccharide biosynthesis protein SpsF|nr:NTP transferase domain-containing protein [Rhodospirillaceae bacterium]MBT5563152.1 NTP transferase domain-containing protein [Rhodospirillaceae bacterium]MBT6243467.1 NTP transferase domain-containing protein [Rhodospirillaceae bacterium]MBT7138313.1 NTP transferase domain-containing protein [Rhodospirillaceae bacterium]